MTTMIDPPMSPLSGNLSSTGPALLPAIAPRLVHRVYERDVFVTNVRVLQYNTFQVSVRWPGAHDFYGPVNPDTHDPLLFLESIRQAGLLVAHVAFDIPVDSKFIVHEKRFSVSPAGLRTDGTRPVDVEMIVTAHDIRRRGRGFAGMRFEFMCLRDGVHIGSAGYLWSCVSAAGYDKLRGAYRTAMPPSRRGSTLVAPHRVGRHDEIDVMLAEPADERGWPMCIDPDHPVIYDHHFDHVPGNASIEAARQAALLLLGRPAALLVGSAFSYTHYIEFDQPCLVRATRGEVVGDRAAVHIVLEQEGQATAEGTLELLVD